MTAKKSQDTKATEEKTEADRIWEEIKEKSIEMFALPNQRVDQYCVPVTIEPSKLYLLVRVSSVLPALETACGPKFTVDLVDKYVTIARAAKK